MNALGHLAGVAAFGAFLALLRRGSRNDAAPARRLPEAAAVLALLWNAGSLAVLASAPGSAGSEWTASLSFAVLSILPAVLLHLALGADYVWLRRAGYAIAGAAAVAHLCETAGLAGASHALGINAITYGFGGLAVVAAVLLSRGRFSRRAAGMRALAAISLFLLAASFVHFGTEHGPGSWTHELIFHHAGIPLALFVLLQDYRFLLLDVFVRILGAGALAVVFSLLLIGAAFSLDMAPSTTPDAGRLAAFLALASGAVLVFPYVRDGLGRLINATLFPRVDRAAATSRIHSLDQQDFWNEAAKTLAEFASARRWELVLEADPEPAWAEIGVPLRAAHEHNRVLWLGPREGGRRYLSDDDADLKLLAEEAAERFETIQREEQQRLLSQAELETLRAQINPHFLFNSLNALYGLIPRQAAEARNTLMRLADIFRYSLEGKRQLVPLEEELAVVDAYLAIERLRLGERLTTQIEIDDGARGVKIPALSIQPLAENAVKHGVGARPAGGCVRISAKRKEEGLLIEVADDGVGFAADSPQAEGHGLRNVRRRLQLCFGEAGNLAVNSSENGTVVQFSVPGS